MSSINNPANTWQRKKPFLIAIMVAIVATCLGAWYIFIPRAALINLPYRWERIPLGQKRTIVIRSLGKATYSDSTTVLQQGEIWVANRTNGDYTLSIYYNRDSIADAFQINFDYKLGFLSKHYLLKAETWK